MHRFTRQAVRALPLALAALLMFGSCARFPITEEITIEFSDDASWATVTAQTTFDLEVQSAAIRSRIAAARSAAVAGVDPWGVRFARIAPDYDRVTFEKSRGTLERVTRSARIPSHDLQQVFSDTSITVALSRGDGWTELAFYPAASSRASREQQRRFAEELRRWSGSVARYVTAVDHMYAYLAERPLRAEYLFAAILDERSVDEAPPVVLEEEQPFVDDVRSSMEEIAAQMDQEAGNASTFAEMADLVHNPFPGRMTIRLPRAPVAVSGFTESAESNDVVVEQVDLFGAISALEGRWVEPDPLAALLRAEVPKAREMAAVRRRSRSVISATEIAEAISAELTRPRSYVVRWAE